MIQTKLTKTSLEAWVALFSKCGNCVSNLQWLGLKKAKIRSMLFDFGAFWSREDFGNVFLLMPKAFQYSSQCFNNATSSVDFEVPFSRGSDRIHQKLTNFPVVDLHVQLFFHFQSNIETKTTKASWKFRKEVNLWLTSSFTQNCSYYRLIINI